MLLYAVKIKLADVIECGRKEAKEQLCAVNDSIDEFCKSKEYLLRAIEFRKDTIKLIALVKKHFVEEDRLKREVAATVTKRLSGDVILNIDIQEVTALQFGKLLNKYIARSHKKDQTANKMRSILPDLEKNGFRMQPEIKEYILKTPKSPDVRGRVKKIEADKALREELDRIYSPIHPKEYRGMPVHYEISANTRENANDIINVLLQGLHANNRIISKRVTNIEFSSVKHFIDDTIDCLSKLGDGGCIVIDFFEDEEIIEDGIFSFHDVDDDWSFWDEDEKRDDKEDDDGWTFWMPNDNDIIKKVAVYIEKNRHNTQFIIVKNDKYVGCDGKKLLKTLKEKIDFIEIKEGLSCEQAQKRYIELLKKAGITGCNIETTCFEKDKYYSIEYVDKHFRNTYQECMTENIYTEYSKEKIKSADKKDISISAKEELDRLIGLNDVKKIIENILALHKVNDMRRKYNEKDTVASKHMLFSGNPGTAKTTVARLFAQIMKEEGILKTGKFVECGRSDLVGQFVGWTAVQIKQKFKEAKGGVLFIDEAYSLVDDSRSFGDEAINTIVAEMENMRDEIVVIFAGYPDKMEAFLDKNEGLKSRIAYHVSFPNYEPNELLAILEKLAADRDLTLDDNAKRKAIDIFNDVYMERDYGNGRYARNLLEKAIMNQASRLVTISEKDIDKENLFILKEEDFVPEASNEKETDKRKIGFI